MTGIRRVNLGMMAVGGLLGMLAIGDRAQAESLTIGAAHTLKPAFQEIVPMFEREYGASIHVVYGPSQTLRRQIETGHPIDVFLPEAVEEIEKLEKQGLTLNGGLRTYAQTSLVLVMSASSRVTPISFHEGLPNRTTRIALGDAKTSALGANTVHALANLDPAQKNRSSLLYAQHSEEILNLVHTGKAEVGILYRVDAINSGHMRIIDETTAGTYTPVRFGGAVVGTCREESLAVAEEFLDFMMSPRIKKLLLKYGFDPVPSHG